jgi:uncharacterized protein (UPF0548 family)
MFLLRKPSPSFVRAFLEEQKKLDLTYSGIGTTASTPPVGYIVDRTRIKLGTGQVTFAAAKDALKKWEQFRLGWVEPCWQDTPVEPEHIVGVLAHVCCLWTLNACRIVYVVDELRKVGFAYGTLPGHIESGEERFTVEWAEDDSVWYDILAFSRPNNLLVRLGYPLARRLQKRFARDSATAMKRAVVTVADMPHSSDEQSEHLGPLTDVALRHLIRAVRKLEDAIEAATGERRTHPPHDTLAGPMPLPVIASADASSARQERTPLGRQSHCLRV